MRTTIKTAILGTVFVACAGGVGSRAFAQDMLVANVPFAFGSSGRMHDAGKYQFHVTDDGQIVELLGPSRADSLAVVLTRLVPPATAPADAHLVFGKVGDTYVLSEVWLPNQDGFLLQESNEHHADRSVKVEHGAKRTS